MRTLVVEDDSSIAQIILQTLKADNIAVDWFSSGSPARSAGVVNDYDLAILDLNIPEYSGIELCQHFRKSGKNFPILFITVCDDISIKTNVLDAGADDYLIKPFSLQELRARIRALGRRPRNLMNEILKAGPLELNTRTRIVKYSGRVVNLRRKEYSLLEFMMKNSGRVLSRTDILEHVWDMNADPFTNTVDVHIRFLRAKIDKNKSHKLIHTVHGQGYRFDYE